MPDLPTLTVTAAQAQRLLAAFGTTDDYKAWLRRKIVEHVRATESAAIETEVAALRASRQQGIDDLLTAPVEVPPAGDGMAPEEGGK